MCDHHDESYVDVRAAAPPRLRAQRRRTHRDHQHHQDPMNPPPRYRDPVGYIVRVAGHLDAHWTAWFGSFTLDCEPDGTTTLRGVVADQAELHGLLVKVRDLGVTLLSVEIVGAPDA